MKYLDLVVRYAEWVFVYISISEALLTLAILILGLVAIVLHHKIHRQEKEFEQMRADFVAIASHELRSPLTAVRWSLAELRTRPTLSPDAREIVNDLYERTCALIARTSTFLQTAAADKGVMDKSSFSICNVAQIMKESIANAQAIGRVKGVSVHEDGSLEIGISIKADASRLRLVFDNLLSNAVKYSPQGTAVTVSCDQKGGTKIFRIRDQGIGIPASELAQVFKGFHRASNAKRSGAIGSGFGLYMAKKIVEFHGGSLTCESEVGKGTTFIVTLPSGT
jgi:signal transduction histidine kinase